MTNFEAAILHFLYAGVEKLNDDCRRIHIQRSNKWDATKDILLVGKRLEHLQDYERTPRTYKKRAMDYWESTIRENRAKRVRHCSELPKENAENEGTDIESMSAEELKAMLKSKGITTRLRSAKKLQELLKKTLKEANGA